VRLQSDALRGSGIRFVFIENICNDPAILQQNYLNKMMYSPDYKGIPTEKVGAQQQAKTHEQNCKGCGEKGPSRRLEPVVLYGQQQSAETVDNSRVL
jgi:hypothetical protein